MTADLAQFYNGLSLRDVWDGRVSAGYVLTLVEQLHLNPYSRVRMISLGGDLRLIGWDANTDLAADRYDQLTQIVASFGKQEVSPDQLYPRPGADKKTSDPTLFAPTIDDFNPASFMKVIAGQ